jgi:hypothetical protein
VKRIIAVLLLVAAVALGVRALDVLPADNAPEVRKKYDTWAGVLRVWVVEDWQVGTGSLERWLNVCAALFEKSCAGVYVNVQPVPADAVRNFLTTGVNPPDVIVYPPGLLSDAEGLRAFSVSADYKTGLDAVGTYEDARYAAAVLTDAHVWVYDPGRLKSLPADMYDVAAACRASDLPALICLNSGLRPAEGSARVLPGVDIGLPGGPTATPEPEGTVACRVGANFLVSDAVYDLYKAGGVDAFVGDLSDLLRASQRSDWAAVVTGAAAWADDMALVSLVSREGERADERAALCEKYVGLLLSDGQALAAKAGALPVARGANAYAGDLALAPVEAALENARHVCAPAFGTRDVTSVGYAYVAGSLSADEGVEALGE